MIRKDAIDWENNFSSLEAGPYWDFYISYLACRSGQASYYCKEGLTKYRVHDTSMTRANARDNLQMRRKWAMGKIFCYERFVEGIKLHEFKPYFKKKLAKAKTALGMSFLRSEQPDLARPHFLEAFRQHQNLQAIVARTLSFIPKSFSS